MGMIVGILIVVASTLGGYAAMGGKVAVLWQPFEAVIIVGAAIGAFIIGNTASVVKATGSAINKSLKGSKYSKDNYVELIRSEERREGKECVSTCRSRGSPDH